MGSKVLPNLDKRQTEPSVTSYFLRMVHSIAVLTEVFDVYIFSLETHIFRPLSLLFAKSPWPESTALHEAPYTVGGQQQSQNILQRLNET